MEKIKVLVVRGVNTPQPLLEAEHLGSTDTTWLKTELCHLIHRGEDSTAFSQQVERVVLDDPEIAVIYIMLDGDPAPDTAPDQDSDEHPHYKMGPVTQWFEATKMEFWFYLGVPVQTNCNWFAGRLALDDQNETGGSPANVE